MEWIEMAFNIHKMIAISTTVFVVIDLAVNSDPSRSVKLFLLSWVPIVNLMILYDLLRPVNSKDRKNEYHG